MPTYTQGGPSSPELGPLVITALQNAFRARGISYGNLTFEYKETSVEYADGARLYKEIDVSGPSLPEVFRGDAILVLQSPDVAVAEIMAMSGSPVYGLPPSASQVQGTTGSATQVPSQTQTAPTGSVPAQQTISGTAPSGSAGSSSSGTIPVGGSGPTQATQDLTFAQRLKALSVAEMGRELATADEWHFYYTRETGTTLPPPEDYGFTGADRFKQVSFETWWQAIHGIAGYTVGEATGMAAGATTGQAVSVTQPIGGQIAAFIKKIFNLFFGGRWASLTAK